MDRINVLWAVSRGYYQDAPGPPKYSNEDISQVYHQAHKHILSIIPMTYTELLVGAPKGNADIVVIDDILPIFPKDMPSLAKWSNYLANLREFARNSPVNYLKGWLYGLKHLSSQVKEHYSPPTLVLLNTKHSQFPQVKAIVREQAESELERALHDNFETVVYLEMLRCHPAKGPVFGIPRTKLYVYPLNTMSSIEGLERLIALRGFLCKVCSH